LATVGGVSGSPRRRGFHCGLALLSLLALLRLRGGMAGLYRNQRTRQNPFLSAGYAVVLKFLGAF
jgi:hypothetical protein